ncbi:MAG: hypothetical protein DMF50_12930 [Acidobacteria bacterium]|nr:MAG: hypothetical protein DMF50_12930 [Acidobacteriota bacterium]
MSSLTSASVGSFIALGSGFRRGSTVSSASWVFPALRSWSARPMVSARRSWALVVVARVARTIAARSMLAKAFFVGSRLRVK